MLIMLSLLLLLPGGISPPPSFAAGLPLPPSPPFSERRRHFTREGRYSQEGKEEEEEEEEEEGRGRQRVSFRWEPEGREGGGDLNAANISPSFLLPSRVDFLSRASSCLSSLPPPPASGEAKKKVLEKGTRVESSPAWVGRRVASDCRGIFWLEPRRKGEDRGGREEGGSHAWWRSLNSFRLPPSLLLLWRCFLFECPLLPPPLFSFLPGGNFSVLPSCRTYGGEEGG